MPARLTKCLSVILSSLLSVFAQTDATSGQSVVSIPILAGVSLQYYGASAGTIGHRNDISPTSWAGFGWNIGVASISAFHNNTVDLNDDRWFYDDGYGNASEIIRVFEGTPAIEKFYLKSAPYSRVLVVDNSPPTGQQRIIKGWEITDVSGNISRFGFLAGEIEDAMRYVPCWGNYIGAGVAGAAAPGKFYYRWDLKQIRDVAGQKSTLTYQVINGSTATGYGYTAQSYPYFLDSPIGDRVMFSFTPAVKSVNEGPLEPPSGDFDFTENRVLGSVSLMKGMEILDKVDFVYSGDPGQINHINYDKKGFAKRLLLGLRSTTNPGNNYDFAYGTAGEIGYLTELRQTKTGKVTTYTYASQTLITENLTSEVGLSLASAELEQTSLVNDLSTAGPAPKTSFPLKARAESGSVLVGNHIFAIRQRSGTGITPSISIEVLDHCRNNWLRGFIPEVTGAEMENTVAYPWPDRLILVRQIKDGSTIISQTVQVYEYIDDRWIRTLNRQFSAATSSLIVKEIEIQQQFGYFVVWEPRDMVLYVFNKVNGGWISTLNSPSGTTTFADGIQDEHGHDNVGLGEGWNWPGPPSVSGYKQITALYTAPNCFGFTYRKRFGGDPVLVAQIFRWDGFAWAHQHADGITTPDNSSWTYDAVNGYSYEYGDVMMQDHLDPAGDGVDPENVARFALFNDYYVAWRSPQTEGEDYDYCNMVIRRYQPSSGHWHYEKFEEPAGIAYVDDGRKIFHWPQRARIFPNQSYLVVTEHQHHFRTSFYRYRQNEGGAWGWRPTSIAAVAGQSSSSTTVTEHGITYTSAKRFAMPVRWFYTMPQYVLVQGDALHGEGHPDNFLWVMRWDETQGEWKSVLNAAEAVANEESYEDGKADVFGQGYNFPNDIDLLYPGEEVLGVWQGTIPEEDPNTDDRQMRIYAFDYAAGAISTTPVAQSADYLNARAIVNQDVSDVLWLEHKQSGTEDPTHQAFVIHARCGNAWDGFPTVKVVKAVAADGGTASVPAVTTSYTYGANGFDASSGTPFFGKVSQKTGSGATGQTESLYETDSTSGNYGMLKIVRQYRDGIKIRVSGRLYNLDPSTTTPLTGYVWLARNRTVQDEPAGPGGDPLNRIWSEASAIGSGGVFTAEMDNPGGAVWMLQYAPSQQAPMSGAVFIVDPARNAVTFTTGNSIFYPLPPTQVRTVRLGFAGEPYFWQNVSIKAGGVPGVGFPYSSIIVCDWDGARDILTTTSNLVSSIAYNYRAASRQVQNRLMATPQIASVEAMVDGVLRRTEYPLYDRANGLPDLTISYNSDGSAMATRTIYACSTGTYFDMMPEDRHMLTQVAQTVQHAHGPGDLTPRIATNDGSVPGQNAGDEISLSFGDLSQGLQPGALVQVAAQILMPVGTDNNAPGDALFRLAFKFSDGTKAYRDFHDGAGSVHVKSLPLLRTIPLGVLFGVCCVDYQFGGGHTPADIREVLVQVTSTARPLDFVIKPPWSQSCRITPNPTAVTKVVASNVTTWKLYNPGGIQPFESYVWKVKMDANGRPVTQYQGFDFHYLYAPGFERQSYVDRYSPAGSIVDKVSPVPGRGDRHDLSLLRNDLFLPIATVKDATFAQTGVFTCDYDMNVDGYFDRENGWAHTDGTPPAGAVCEVTDAKPHFGARSLHVKNCKAAVKRTYLASREDAFVFSAWVYPVSTNPILFSISLVVDNVDRAETRYDYAYDQPKGLRANAWQLVEFPVRLLTPTMPMTLNYQIDGLNEDFLYSWVGNVPGAAPAEFYVDDIRIYPKDALVTSAYYDPKWRKPVITVDANNNPGVKTVYDLFGRVSEKRRTSKTDPGQSFVAQRRQYHLAGE